MSQCPEAGLDGHSGHPAVVVVEEDRRFAAEPAKMSLIAQMMTVMAQFRTSRAIRKLAQVRYAYHSASQ